MSLAEQIETPDMAGSKHCSRSPHEEFSRIARLLPRQRTNRDGCRSRGRYSVVQWRLPAVVDEPPICGLDEPDASVPSRIPDTTGQLKDTPQPSGFQGSQALSDPASPEARPVLDAMTADIRDEIAKGDDFKIDMVSDEGRQLSSASAVLDYLDELDRFSARVDLCGAVRRVD